MSGKATLYFVVTKVTAPKGSSFNLVLSVGDSKVTLGTGKARGTSYSLPYKITKEVTQDGSSSYRSCAAQINFLEGETISTTGSIRIKLDEFINAANIDVKEYPISVPSKEGVSVHIGISLIPDGGAEPSNYAEFGETAKVISNEMRQESDSSSHHSHHHSSQPEPPADNQMEGAEEIVESESGRKHRRKRGTKDTNDGTFISDGGHTHKRRHRSHTTQPAAPAPVETAPAPAPAPAEPPADGSMEGAEEIVESESGRKHRRKRGTKDTNDGTFISDGGHTHKRKHRSHKPADTPAAETKPEEPKQEQPKPEEPKQEQPKQEEPKPEEPKQEQPKPEEPKQEEPKPEEPKPEEPKQEEPKQEEPKPEEPKQEETKLQESTPIENSTNQNTLTANDIENNPQLAKQVSDLKDVVEKQTNWIRSLYSKLSDHGLSQSMKPGDFPSFPTGDSDLSQTLKSRSLKTGGNIEQDDSPSRLENDLQKACQTGEQNANSIRYRNMPLLHAGVNNIEEEKYENMNNNYDDGPLRHFHFAKNEIKEPEEPIFSTSDGLTLSYSIRNDCFFRPHYNFEMLDISGRFSFEVFQSPFEIEQEPLSIDCKYNPTIEYNSGDGGYPDIPAFSPTRSRFQTENKNYSSYYINENQNDNPSIYQERDHVFSPTNDRNAKLSISNLDEDNSQPFRYNPNNYNRPPIIDNNFHSAFYNSSDHAYIPQKLTIGDSNNSNNDFNSGYPNPVIENGTSLNNDETNNFIPNNTNFVIHERNIELNQFTNSSNSFSNSNPNNNQNSSPNFSPSSTQSFNSQPLLIEQQNQLKQKIQEQMQKQQKQLQKQMDELHQMRKELTEETQRMQEQMVLQMQQQMQMQQQNMQSMQLDMEKKKQLMQMELEKERKQIEMEKERKQMEMEKERKQMDNSKQLLELQMEREKELMEKERAKMEKERQTLRQQRLLQEEELLQLKNQRELQQKEMQQLQRLQDLHKQQQQELQEQQEQHIQQRRELQQQQSLSPSTNQQADLFQQLPNSLSVNSNQQSDPQQPFPSPSNQSFEPQQQLFSSPASLNQQIEAQQLQQQLQNQQDRQILVIQQEQPENFSFGGNDNQSPSLPLQNNNDLYNSKSRQFDCKICTDETIYLPPKQKQGQNQPFSQNQVNNFSSFPTNFQPIPDPDNSININGITTQEEEEEVEAEGPSNANTTQQPQDTQQKINFNQEASLLQNSENNGLNSEAVDKNNNFNYPQTQLVSLDDADINVVLHRSNTDVSNKNINKILTFDKSTAPPLLNQTQEASPLLKQQRKANSTNNLDQRNLNNFDDENGGFNNRNDDESLITNLEQDQNTNYQYNPRTIDLRIPKTIVD